VACANYYLLVLAALMTREALCVVCVTACPRELQVDCGGGTVACRSACEAFGQDQYCCSGAYATPTACRPTAYSSVFKSACPRAYSYAYDDRSSTFTCHSAAGYTIAFCLPCSE